jgi:predicted pyridoxine 5'-phosphate oxidase superfamily flavin-nucleotide-binding protein
VNLYHDGSRDLQDRFDTRRLADQLAERFGRTAFTPEDKAFVESRAMFFLATADEQGRPDCSYKGGLPGFVRITGAAEISFPSYDGNGMFLSLGNIRVNASVGLLFLDFEQPRRLRVKGKARLEEATGEFEGAQLIVRVNAEAIFPNCPRYIHRLQLVETSVYAPRPGYEPPEPGWKKQFKDVLPGKG